MKLFSCNLIKYLDINRYLLKIILLNCLQWIKETIHNKYQINTYGKLSNYLLKYLCN